MGTANRFIIFKPDPFYVAMLSIKFCALLQRVPVKMLYHSAAEAERFPTK